MKYEEFRKHFTNVPFFHSRTFTQLTDNPAFLRRQVSTWIEKGYIIALKRGLYTLREQDRSNSFNLFFLANYIYQPSYISLESALSYYGIIPERVYGITSVSSRKTNVFENQYGQFIYRHMQMDLYGEYISKKDEFGNVYHIATLEKALIDFLYFKAMTLKKFDKTIFQDSFRFQNLAQINEELLTTLSHGFKQKKLQLLIRWLLEFKEHD